MNVTPNYNQVCHLLLRHPLSSWGKVPGPYDPRSWWSRFCTTLSFAAICDLDFNLGGIVMFRARDLTPCSNYTLHIAPRFGEFSFEANSVKANTHLGDCEQDLQDQSLEEKVNSTTSQTFINVKQGHSKGTSPSSKGSTPFLSNTVILLSVILFVCFGKYN